MNLDKAEQLQQLSTTISQDLICPLKDAAKNQVFGKGNPYAQILFIGEAPGAKEDELGEPFVGAAGKNLDKLLHTIGLTLHDVYIANILKYRPPNNRPPKPDEMVRHTPFLLEQIRIIQPKIIVTLGNFATKYMLAKCDVKQMKKISGITQLHGQMQVLTFGNIEVHVFPLFHPAAMMYNPKLRDVLAKDFIGLADALKELK